MFTSCTAIVNKMMNVDLLCEENMNEINKHAKLCQNPSETALRQSILLNPNQFPFQVIYTRTTKLTIKHHSNG